MTDAINGLSPVEGNEDLIEKYDKAVIGVDPSLGQDQTGAVIIGPSVEEIETTDSLPATNEEVIPPVVTTSIQNTHEVKQSLTPPAHVEKGMKILTGGESARLDEAARANWRPMNKLGAVRNIQSTKRENA